MENFRPRRRSKILPLLGYVLVILLFSLVPMGSNRIEIPSEIQDPLHIPAFAAFYILVLQALGNISIITWKRIICVLSGAFVVGALSEYAQRFVPGRCASAEHIVRDMIGAAIGIGIYYWIKGSKPGLLRRIICG